VIRRQFVEISNPGSCPNTRAMTATLASSSLRGIFDAFVKPLQWGRDLKKIHTLSRLRTRLHTAKGRELGE